MNKAYLPYLHYAVLGILVYAIVFIKLGSFHMRWWDESMFAVNTYEMIQNGKWFSFYFDLKPDLYNTKPPLTSWLQILMVKTFGYNELALRLPSALATFGTVLLLFNFVTRHFSRFLAWISVLVLLTSYGFIHFHTARTADSDALLTFFVFATNLAFIRFILHERRTDVFWFFGLITLAFMVKLYASFLFIPAYLFILIYQKKLKSFIFNRAFWLGLVGFIFIISVMVYLRELDTPGYLHELIYKDAGRITVEVEDHKEPFLFYIDNFLDTRFGPWFVLTLMGGVLVFFQKDKIKRLIGVYFIAFILSMLAIIMASVTKLEWYDMPLYPLMALLAALPIYQLINHLKTKNAEMKASMKYGLLALVFFYPLFSMMSKVQGNTIPVGEKLLEANEIYLFRKHKSGVNLDGIKVYSEAWKGSLIFYKYKLWEDSQTISLVNDLSLLSINDTVLLSEKKLEAKLSEKYTMKAIDGLHNATLYVLEGQK